MGYGVAMQYEDQSGAMRQMKELLKDQAKFRAKLDRVVRKIETSSERTAKLAERNKTRAKNSGVRKQPPTQTAGVDGGSLKIHGDKLKLDGDGAGNGAAKDEPDQRLRAGAISGRGVL